MLWEGEERTGMTNDLLHLRVSFCGVSTCPLSLCCQALGWEQAVFGRRVQKG